MNDKIINELLSKADRIIDRVRANYETELANNYRKVLLDIKSKIASIYEKYGEGVKYSDLQKIKRLDSIFAQINTMAKNINVESSQIIKNAIQNIFEEGYYTSAFSFQAVINETLNFTKIDPDLILKSLKNPLDKIGWKTRNRKNILQMTASIRDEITQGFINGKGYSHTAQRINDRLNIGVNKAIRIVRTEGHRVQNQSFKESFSTAKKNIKPTGLELVKIWDATLDNRTRKRHGDMDGVEANEDGKFKFKGKLVDGPGLTGSADDDINCRCRQRFQLVGYAPKVRKDNVSGELIEYKTYKKWKEGLPK